MKHGIYSEEGERRHLRFKGAILRKDPENKDNCLAQFDDRYLLEAFNWTSIPISAFINFTGKW